MTAQPVSSIKTHRISSEQPFHTRDKVRPRSLDDEMKMIAHQAIGMHLPASLRASLAERFQEGFSVDLVAKNCLPSIPTVQQMIKRAFVFDPDLAGHAERFTKLAVAVSRVRTDPYWCPGIRSRWLLAWRGSTVTVLRGQL